MAKQMENVSPGHFGPDRRKKKKKPEKEKKFVPGGGRSKVATPGIDADAKHLFAKEVQRAREIKKAQKEKAVRSKSAGKSAVASSLTGTMGKSAEAVREKKNKEIEAAIEREMKKKKK